MIRFDSVAIIIIMVHQQESIIRTWINQKVYNDSSHWGFAPREVACGSAGLAQFLLGSASTTT